jgi:hypothetical protein
MLSIRDVEIRKSKYGPVADVIVAGPDHQLEELLDMYNKPLSRDFWGVDRDQFAWEYDGALRLGFLASESEAREAVKDAVRILGLPRPNPSEEDVQFALVISSTKRYASHNKKLLKKMMGRVPDQEKEIRGRTIFMYFYDSRKALTKQLKSMDQDVDLIEAEFEVVEYTVSDDLFNDEDDEGFRKNAVKASDYLKRVGATPRPREDSEPEVARHEAPKRKKPQDAPPEPSRKQRTAQIRPPVPRESPYERMVVPKKVALVQVNGTSNATKLDVETLVELLRMAGADRGRKVEENIFEITANRPYGSLLYIYDNAPQHWVVYLSPPLPTPNGASPSKMIINFPRQNPPPAREIDVVKSVVSILNQ